MTSATPATSTPATPTTAPFVTTGDRTPLDCPVIAAVDFVHPNED
ncbi:hypothetical protein [Sanguibacter massiliensis]|nr:hypothetical protein [Sanguibacter massiliensis]